MPVRISAWSTLTLGLAANLFASAALADPPAEPAPAAEQTEKKPDQPREEGRREGEGRGEGRSGEGEGRGEGRRPRGEGSGPSGPGGPQMLTPEQRRERLLAPYIEALPDLTEEQKTKIVEIVEAANAENRAARMNPDLSLEQKAALQQKARDEMPNRIIPALTEPQRLKWEEFQKEQRELQAATIGQLGELKGLETREEKRARLSAGYEEILEELNIKKKTEILAALAAEDETIAAAKANVALTDKQRQEAITKAEAEATARIHAQLTAEQRKQWEKAKKARANKPAPVITPATEKALPH